MRTLFGLWSAEADRREPVALPDTAADTSAEPVATALLPAADRDQPVFHDRRHLPLTYVALAAVVALAVSVLAFTGLLLKMERRHTRHIDVLLDRLAHAYGRTWTPAPVAEPEIAVERELVFADVDNENL